MIRLASLIKAFEARFMERYEEAILPSHQKALSAMQQCRKRSNHHMLAECTGCHKRVFIPHSCGHRSCPHCQNHEGWRWIENQLSKQLPTQYYLITFTLPHQLRRLAWKNQKVVYALMFVCVKELLKTFTRNDKQLRGAAGFTAILHTHCRKLDYHPHIHVVMPAASINIKNRQWRVKSGKYLFSHKALAKVFRAKLLKSLVDHHLQVPRGCPQKWVVDCKRVGNGDKALIYLGRYLYKGVIQEKDILTCKGGNVTYRYMDAKAKKYRTRTVPGEYFLWLLMQHVLPKGFRKVRCYGFLHPCSKKMIALLQLVLRFNPMAVPGKLKPRTKFSCKQCGADMQIIRTMIPPALVWQTASDT